MSKKTQNIQRFCANLLFTTILIFLAFAAQAHAQKMVVKNNKKEVEKPTIIITGSVVCKTTFVAPMAKTFAEQNKMDVRVFSGGTETGISAVHNRFADLALSSRRLTGEERGIGLQDTLIAYDAIAVIVNRNNPIEQLSIKDLQKILLGKTKSWQELGWRDASITVILPDEGSGTRTLFLQSLLAGKEPKITPREEISTFGTVAALQNDTLAISICSLTQTHYQHLKVLKVEGIAPSPETIADRSYPLIAPISAVTLGRPNERAALFIDWLRNGPPAKLIAANFTLPVQQRNQYAE